MINWDKIEERLNNLHCNPCDDDGVYILNKYAMRLTYEFLEVLKKMDCCYSDPLVNLFYDTFDKGILLEWWGRKERKITLYICSDRIDYLKVNGEFIEDMEDGSFNIEDEVIIKELFDWLDGQENDDIKKQLQISIQEAAEGKLNYLGDFSRYIKEGAEE